MTTFTCPPPRTDASRVLLGHGGGGKLTKSLIESMLLPAFDNALLAQLHDGAVFEAEGARLALTTDSYVVQPLFFPGGDIGRMAVCGTVNDLAMCGARPRFLSVGLILEEGLPMETLSAVVNSMAAAARETGVTIVTGDTKVVDRGKGDGIFINTTGVGLVPAGVSVHPGRVVPGDAVLLSGDVGRHGLAIMASREGLEFDTTIESDCAPLAGMIQDLLATEVDVHCLRDLTRGGLGTALIEIAESAGREIHIQESCIPVHEAVHGACEVLGLDPLFAANEGRCIAFLPQGQADRALDVLRQHTPGTGAAQIGRVTESATGCVSMQTLGGEILLDMPSGEQLPRIC